ncbi:MAG TPA: ABC transporter ATP-binding protein [Burkholderiaceae bacterium]|nr:ABC transporter ATP-binding protein [Burkholderiaceae bacterium]
MAERLIEARGLDTYYGSSHVLRGVDFRLERGESVGLMGRNGMGKTTLIKSLLGLLPVRAGEISIAGRPMRGAPPYRIARAGVAYVPEGRGIFPTLSVIENLVMAARPGVRGQRDWTLERVLRTFPRLEERRHHGGTQLSGGEQQMLSIGRALMTNPDALFLDEATEGLAPLIVAEIWAIVGRIRESGIATVVVDKNFRSVLKATDRAVVMVKGQVALEGPSSALRDDPQQLNRFLGV